MEFNRQPNSSKGTMSATTPNSSTNTAELYSNSMNIQSPKSSPPTTTPASNEESKLVGDLINLQNILPNSINSSNQNSFYNNLNEINQDMIDKVFNNFYE